MPQNTVDSLYDKWGGIPRYVLEKYDDWAAQKDLENAIIKCTRLGIITYTGYEGEDEHMSYLLHIIVQIEPPVREGTAPLATDRYCIYHIDVASEYVANRLTGKY